MWEAQWTSFMWMALMHQYQHQAISWVKLPRKSPVHIGNLLTQWDVVTSGSLLISQWYFPTQNQEFLSSYGINNVLVQTSILPPIMHKLLADHGRCYMQNC